MFLKILSQGLFFNKVAGYNFVKKEALAQVFSCEFDENLGTLFFMEHLRWLLLKQVEASYFSRFYVICENEK